MGLRVRAAGHGMKSRAIHCLIALAALPACNLALGLDDHERYPPDCGKALANGTPEYSFADDETNHCYSVVHFIQDIDMPMQMGATFDVADNSCVEDGGYLACV